MKITIADRLKPFSHTPGQSFIIPGTLCSVAAYPTALILMDEEGNQKEFSFNVQGPIDPFTVEQDLEAKKLRIYGEALQGYFRISVKKEGNLLKLTFEKTPSSGIVSDGKTFFSGDVIELMSLPEPTFVSEERLFLGSSKQKEVDLIRRRKDLREIVPLWHKLGLMTPCKEAHSECITKDKKILEALLFNTYFAHFSAGLVPRKEDIEKQGLCPVLPFSKDLLSQGASLIRSLFFQEKEEGIYILPCILPSFVCGKFVQVESTSGCIFDLEWTKHKLRKMFIEVRKDQVLKLHFPKEIESFRLKTSFKDRGKMLSTTNVEISVKAEDRLWLDLFQK